MNGVSLEEVEKQIQNKKANWSPVKQLSKSLQSRDIKRSLGLRVEEEQLRKMRSAPALDVDGIIAEFGKSSQREARVLSSVDWRNYNGQNAVTSIKDQRSCGSCVAFGVAATVESMAIIEHNQQHDLSEAELFFCAGPQAGAGACPGGGWWPSNAMPYLTSTGVSEENCFPYSDQHTPCNTCSDRDKQAVYISRSIEIFDVNDRKKYISNIGPMIGGMWVFADFPLYGSGVYSHVTGENVGGHCIQIIGYDDGVGCWICKNSWGPDWGDSGCFKIAYGEPDCGMDTQFPFWGVLGIRSNKK